MNARQRQVEAVLGRRRRQVERIFAQEAFLGAAQVVEGKPAGCQLLGEDVRVLHGRDPIIGYRIGSPSVPTTMEVVGAYVVGDIRLDAQTLLDKAHEILVAPDAPKCFLVTEPALALLWRSVELQHVPGS